ncbi:hypothetical protein TREES_T100008697 [Tupaia chinensis]|uniref:Uncharacterized protein n=1 Tax=Tupaia chinensis TaxID=246437 RepID=L9L149_TUPCH|nr:hypothetical protein TREES_T100008697 [Tupaia chinensis]
MASRGPSPESAFWGVDRTNAHRSAGVLPLLCVHSVARARALEQTRVVGAAGGRRGGAALRMLCGYRAAAGGGGRDVTVPPRG